MGVGTPPRPIEPELVYPGGIVRLVRRPAEWIWRRVESFEFLDDVTIRRRVSGADTQVLELAGQADPPDGAADPAA